MSKITKADLKACAEKAGISTAMPDWLDKFISALQALLDLLHPRAAAATATADCCHEDYLCAIECAQVEALMANAKALKVTHCALEQCCE